MTCQKIEHFFTLGFSLCYLFLLLCYIRQQTGIQMYRQVHFFIVDLRFVGFSCDFHFDVTLSIAKKFILLVKRFDDNYNDMQLMICQ